MKAPDCIGLNSTNPLAVSNIPAFHTWAGWMDGIYYLAVSLTMA
jgi:hypothetical protein